MLKKIFLVTSISDLKTSVICNNFSFSDILYDNIIQTEFCPSSLKED